MPIKVYFFHPEKKYCHSYHSGNTINLHKICCLNTVNYASTNKQKAYYSGIRASHLPYEAITIICAYGI